MAIILWLFQLAIDILKQRRINRKRIPHQTWIYIMKNAPRFALIKDINNTGVVRSALDIHWSHGVPIS